MHSQSSQTGSTLLYALVLMVTLLGIGLGVSRIISIQFESIKEAGSSVLAFSAADTGSDHALYVDKKHCHTIEPEATTDLFNCMDTNLPSGDQTLPNGAVYAFELLEGGSGNCFGSAYCVDAKGRYKENFTSPEAIRKVRITR